MIPQAPPISQHALEILAEAISQLSACFIAGAIAVFCLVELRDYFGRRAQRLDGRNGRGK